MTKIVLNGVGQDMTALDLIGLFDYTDESLSPTVARFFDDADNYTEFTGSGFVFDTTTIPGVVIPLAGTVTGAINVENGVTTLTYSDASISAAAIYNFALSNDVEGFYSVALGGNDRIIGSNYSDVLVAGAGNDVMSGRRGNDSMFGGDNNDRMNGDGGRDILRGENGADRIDGGNGADLMIGGRGSDRFYFTSALDSGIDRIKDLDPDRDFICLDDAVFAGIGAEGGAMLAGAFVTSASGIPALDADDRIIYETSTGNLFYDSDGSGSEVAVQFARLINLAALTADDILVA